MENFTQLQNTKKKLEEEKMRVKKELNKIKGQLGELLEEKEKLDRENIEVKKEIEFVTREEDDEQHENQGEKIQNVTEQLAMFTSKKKDVQNRNETLEEKCRIMENQFEELMKVAEAEENSAVFYGKLEEIRKEKEKLIKEDEDIENETKELWREAQNIKSGMENLAKVNSCLDEDSKEIQAIFESINAERFKLVTEDRLLTERFPLILEALEKVCGERKELSNKIDATEDIDERDDLLNMDLEAALKQKEVEDLFDDWKKKKEKLLDDNKDLDILMIRLQEKCDVLNNKKIELSRRNKELEDDSEQLKEKFSKNQFRKENITREYKIKENTLNRVTEEVDTFYNGDEIYKKEALEELLKKFEGIKCEKSIIVKEDLEISNKIESLNSRYELLCTGKIEGDKGFKQKVLEEKLKVLIEKKESFLEQDHNIAEQFEKYERNIDELQQLKLKLTKQIEDVDWQLCLNGNSITK